jgi:hypothetical protein
LIMSRCFHEALLNILLSRCIHLSHYLLIRLLDLYGAIA